MKKSEQFAKNGAIILALVGVFTNKHMVVGHKTQRRLKDAVFAFEWPKGF